MQSAKRCEQLRLVLCRHAAVEVVVSKPEFSVHPLEVPLILRERPESVSSPSIDDATAMRTERYDWFVLRAC